MTDAPQRGVFFAKGPVGDDFRSFIDDAPDWAPGDAEFLDADRPHELQVRPLLKSERTPRTTGEYPPGAHFLIYRSPTGKQLRAIVRLPFSRRKNIRSTAEYAVRQVAKFSAAHGVLFDMALRGLDPFTTPITVVQI